MKLCENGNSRRPRNAHEDGRLCELVGMNQADVVLAYERVGGVHPRSVRPQRMTPLPVRRVMNRDSETCDGFDDDRLVTPDHR